MDSSIGFEFDNSLADEIAADKKRDHEIQLKENER
jgi:hypothetical protein